MNFVSYNQLVKDTTEMIKLMPRYDLVIAIPRSGLLPGTIMALHWNCPITTPDLLGRTLGEGVRCKLPKSIKRVLLIDDSYLKGNAMREALDKCKIFSLVPDTCAIYCSSPGDVNHLTYAGKLVPQPRIFEWNWLHHNPVIPHSCFDIDGVLCRPPMREENDYGYNYDKFIKETQPRFVPSLCIGTIVTGRLEKYRKQTEEWLMRNGIEYNDLFMRPSRDIGIIEYKANTYKGLPDRYLFIEDEEHQASAIADLTKKRVLCVTNWRMY